jgi:cobalamin biosynthetic protein CobC
LNDRSICTDASASTSTPIAHGGRLADARRLFPEAPEPWLDLSTGINPIPYPVDVPEEAWTRLPDGIAPLQEAAAIAYGLPDPAMVVPAPGTQLLISVLPHLLPQAQVRILGPTYSEHAIAWRGAGSAVREVEDLAQLEGASCAVLCNPNNPDGRRFEPAELLRCGAGLLVVDEAFADFEPGLSLAPSLPLPGVVILRSFGKAYGLAGLRLGFALAEPGLANRIRAGLGPWAVSGPAAAVGTRALGHRFWKEAAADRLARDVQMLDALLRPHLDVIGGTSLFRLAAGAGAPDVFARLGQAGIYVRRFASHPQWLRFGLPGPQAEWDRLREGLLRLP